MEYKIESNTKNLTTQLEINNDGEKRLIKFTALLVNHKASPSGRYIYCQCANSSGEDSGRFAKIDSKNIEIVYSIIPEWGWADDYIFEGDELIIRVKCGDFHVNEEGGIVDRNGYYERRIIAADVNMFEAIPMYFVLHGENHVNVGNVLFYIDLFISKMKGEYHGVGWAVKSLKTKAEILRRHGRNHDALQCCIDAIYLDEKAAVKRIMSSLLKKENKCANDFAVSEVILKLKNSVGEVRNKEMIKVSDNREHFKKVMTGEPNILPPIARIEIPLDINELCKTTPTRTIKKKTGLLSFILKVMGLKW